MDTIAQGKPEA